MSINPTNKASAKLLFDWFKTLEKEAKLEFLGAVHLNYPYYYDIGTMPPALKKFYK